MAKKSNKNIRIKSLFNNKNIIVALGIGALVLTSSLGYLLYNQTTDTAKATSTSYSNGQVSIDKKYVVGGVENDTLNVAQGSTVTVRLRYNNTGDTALTGASIRDSLPSGFNYVTGSFRNCLNPSIDVTYCDTLSSTNKDTAFSTLISTNGVSPIAGLYDAGSTSSNGGTLPNANTGILDVGRKPIVTITDCRYQTIRSASGISVPDQTAFSYLAQSGYSNADCPAEGYAKMTDTPGESNRTNSFFIAGKRNITVTDCRYQYIFNVNGSSIADQTSFSYLSEYGLSNAQCPSAETYPKMTDISGESNRSNTFDLLGKRKISITNCRYQLNRVVNGTSLSLIHI